MIIRFKTEPQDIEDSNAAGAQTPALRSSPAVVEEKKLTTLLNDVERFIRRFVVVTDDQSAVLTLWVLHAHALDAFDCTPYLQVTSATKGAGKTRLLEVFELLVPQPWLTGRTSAAALTRKVNGESPTLLLDESDTAFGSEKEYAEALRGILNSGYRRSGRSTLCVRQGGDWSYQSFSTFCAKATRASAACHPPWPIARSRSH